MTIEYLFSHLNSFPVPINCIIFTVKYSVMQLTLFLCAGNIIIVS